MPSPAYDQASTHPPELAVAQKVKDLKRKNECDVGIDYQSLRSSGFTLNSGQQMNELRDPHPSEDAGEP